MVDLPPYDFDTMLAARGVSMPANSARRILRAAQRGITSISSVMTTPPTLSVGAANTASTINGQTTAFGQGMYQAIDLTVTEDVSGRFASDGSQYAGVGKTSLLNGTRGGTFGGKRLATDATALDICLATTSGVAIYVTDPVAGLRQRVTANDYTTDGTNSLTDGSKHYLKMLFATTAVKIIELYGSNTLALRGINVNAGASIWRAPSPDQPNIVLQWDSWGFNTLSSGTNPIRLAVPQFFGEQLGVSNVFSIAAAGTGFLNDAGTIGTYRARMLNGDVDPGNVGNPDLFIMAGSINDDPQVNAAYTDAAVQAEVTLTVALAMQRMPNALIMVTGPQQTPASAQRPQFTAQSRYDAIKAGALAAMGSDPRCFYLDNSPAGEAWYANTTRNAAYIGTDNAHPNDAGKAYYGYRMAQSALAAIRSRYA